MTSTTPTELAVARERAAYLADAGDALDVAHDLITDSRDLDLRPNAAPFYDSVLAIIQILRKHVPAMAHSATTLKEVK